MIGLDENSNIVIKTNISKTDVYDVLLMKTAVLNLVSSQRDDFKNHDDCYWAVELVKLIEFETDQLCLK